ncbi:MAG: multifunctional oxoglutarate decarboxylase/oxoglutarate dehydrogenase thiamine pyrophosphate-binding subunit/dihydrolipoyllysine-residue succinyltransferase subunit, partial [Brevibacterium aurantiacum]|nr:multifunctional oxoglutarate decarboxylase/oxoglutarate dehydrogenase thiamine pyrophosphate-binding subunit/dihydrolipoyllysine-residue succinyltransferase subunit [Brevibacterium aurantiacum]
MSVNTPNRTVDDFGSNEWLVEELYEQYKSDKNSVDQSWWPFFDKYEKNGDGAAAKTAKAQPAAESSAKPAAKSNSKAAPKAAAKSADKSANSKADTVPDDSPRGVSPSSAQTETLKAETKSVPKVVVKDTEPKPAPEETVTPLRGPAKLIAKNMDDSIEVPTATSVRAMPATAL